MTKLVLFVLATVIALAFADRIFLPKDKYGAVLKIYTQSGSLEDKTRQVDQLTSGYSADEKLVVDSIKKFFAKRAEVLAKLSAPTKALLGEIKHLRQQQRTAFEKIDKNEQKAANFILSGKPPTSVNAEGTHKLTTDTSVDEGISFE